MACCALHVGDVVIPEQWAYHAESVYLNPDGRGGHVRPAYFKATYENFGMIFPNDVTAVREGESAFVRMPVFPADPKLLGDATDSTAATMPVERVRYHHQEVMGRMIPVVREVRVSLR